MSQMFYLFSISSTSGSCLSVPSRSSVLIRVSLVSISECRLHSVHMYGIPRRNIYSQHGPVTLGLLCWKIFCFSPCIVTVNYFLMTVISWPIGHVTTYHATTSGDPCTVYCTVYCTLENLRFFFSHDFHFQKTVKGKWGQCKIMMQK